MTEPDDDVDVQHNAILELQWIALVSGVCGLFSSRSIVCTEREFDELEDSILDRMK